MANINSVITYNANLSPAQAQIKALTGQVGALSAAFNTLDKSALSAQRSLASTFAANAGQIGGFTAQTIKATNAVETFGKQLAANRLTMRESFREAVTGYTRQTSMLRQLAEQQVRYQQSVAIPTGAGQAMMMTPQSISAASNAAQLASQRFSIFNQLVNNGATSMLNWGKNTQWAGRQLMVGFTVPLMLFTAVASKQFRELDKELTRFQKVYGSDLGGSISESTKRMRDDVQQLAYDISKTYGIAAKDTAALAADIAATGAEGEQLMASVQQTTRLAVLGEVDRQEAMKATLSLQSAFRMNTNELAESINFLNAVENQTSATLEDLATAIPKVGPVVRSLGGDVRDLATLLVAMREGGIPAAEAANALKSGLASLINPTKQASLVAKQYGVDLVGLVEANRGQLMPTIYAMQDALNGLDSFSRSKIIEQIFGKYQFARMTALFDNIGRTGSQTQSVIELASKSSAELAAIANGEIRTLTESTAVKFQRTLEELKNSIIPIGQTLTETLIPIFELIGKGVKMFTSFFQSLPEPVKNFAKYGVAIAALAGPVIMLVGLFGNLIANGIKFGMMLTRMGARIAGIKTEKFQLLNADVMAAKLGVDNLTTSFTTQETAMKRLVGVMSSYEQSLRRLSIANPALFIPGAVPGPRGVVPVRRQTGSTSPEKVPGGYGGGDRIPALLEPGEMVVRKEAVAQYAPIISAMNRGNLPGYAVGTGSPLGGAGSKKIVTPEGEVYFRKQQRKDDRYQWKYSRPSGLENLGSQEEARMHLASTGGEAKNLIIRTKQAGSQYLAWLDSLFIIGNQFQNQFENLAAGTGQNARAIQKNVAEALKNSNVAQDQIDRIITNLTNGVLQHEQDLQVYKSAIQRMSAKGLDDKTLAQLSGLRLAMQNNPSVLTGSNPQQIRGAIQTNLSSLTQIRSIMNTPEFKNATTAGQLETKALLQEARTSIITATRNLMTQLTQLSGQAGIDISSVIAQMLTGIPEDIRKELMRSIDANSPSRRIQPAAKEAGKSLGDGAVIGIQEGLKQSTAGRKIIAGPVGGGGIESISNAQKIAQADQSILKLKDMQLKHTADRVRAEVELLALQKAYARGEINIVQFKEQERKLAADKKIAAEKELRIQNIINEKKQRIADADQAQLRSEQEEARGAARRAAASWSPSGWLAGGASPYAVPKNAGSTTFLGMPSVPPKTGATGPSASLNDAQETSKQRGGGLMNAAFAASMAMSSVSMLGGASSDAAMKIGLFSTALMTATMLMQSVSAKGMFTNFLGLSSAGKGLTGLGAKAAGPAAAGVASSAVKGTGAVLPTFAAARGVGGVGGGLMMAGRALSFLGGPIGIAAGIGITAAITGFMMYRNAAEEARERAIAAFNDPVKSAEYFGETIMNVSDILEKNRLANISEDLEDIDKALREAVRQDYAPLIEQIKYLSAGSGAQALSVAYSNMIISGMSAENAKATIEAIAAEAGKAGGEAFNEAVSQGFLVESITIEEAVQNIISQFKPEEAIYGKTGETLKQVLEKEIAAVEQEIITLQTPVLGTEGYVYDPEAQKQVSFLLDKLDQLETRLKELSQINPEAISQILDSMIMAYQQDPSAAIQGIKDLGQAINELEDEGDRIAALEEITRYLENSYGYEWQRIGQYIDSSNEKIVATQMLAAGISLESAINDAGEFDAALGQAYVTAKMLADETARAASELQTDLTDRIVSDIEKERQAVETEIKNIEDANAKLIRGYSRRKRESQEAFEIDQENRQNTIESMQDEVEQKRRIFDEEMEQLDDKKEAVEKSSEAYINSLEKTQKAESFYSQQRKTSLGALEKLASGDIFGFLKEREQISQDAQEFSYDEMITGIEERRDLELDAIDEVREKKQKEQDEYDQMMEDRIKSEQDLMDEQQKAHDAQMQHYDKQIKKAERERDRKITVKQEEVAKLNDMQETASRDILDFQKRYSKEWDKYSVYAKDIEYLQALNVLAIYQRGGVTLTQAAVTAKVPLGVAVKYEAQGLYASTAPSPGGGGGVVNPWTTPYRNLKEPQEDTQNLSQQVRDMTVEGDIVVNGDIVGGSTDNNSGLNNDGTIDTDGNPNTGGGNANGGLIGGGKVVGPGGPKSDVIPAMLSNGEYVIKASSVSKYGTDLMHSINAGKFADGGLIQKFAEGGLAFNKNVLNNLGYSLTTAKNVEKHLDAGGWPLNKQRLAWTIAMRESGGNSKLYHDNTTDPSTYSPGNGDYGLFQVNKKGYGSEPWFNIQKLLDGDYNSSVAYKNISRGGKYYLPWAMKPSYNGTSSGFDWGPHYGGRPSWGAETEKRTNDLWSAVMGQTSVPSPSERNKNVGGKNTDPASIESPPSKGLFGLLNFVKRKINNENNNAPNNTNPPENGPSDSASKALNYAKQQLGKPYSFNAQPPDSWDCSKLTAWSWNEATGKNILTPYSHTQATQIQKRVTGLKNGQISGLSLGDILYYKTENDPSYGHTAMYAGDNKLIEAASPATGVILEDINSWDTGINPKTGEPRFQWAGPPIGYADGGIVKQVRWAQRNLIGTPYGLGHISYDGKLPAAAYKNDYRPSSIGCSPFTHLIYARGGKPYIHPYRAAIQEQNGGRGLFPSEYEPGDAVFFKGSDGEPTSHVGLLTRPLGRDNWSMIHSSASKGKVLEEGIPTLVSRIRKKSPDFSVSSVKRLNTGGIIKMFEDGGGVSGPGGPRSDLIPAMLSNGEYVVKASSVAKYGKGFMDQINAGHFASGGIASISPRMADSVKFANGGFVGSMPTATPTFGMPQMETISPATMNANITNNSGGSSNSSTRNSSKVNIVINGAGGKNANAIANKVISMINQANGRRNHSRSAG